MKITRTLCLLPILAVAVLAAIGVPVQTFVVAASPQKGWLPLPEGQIERIAFGSFPRTWTIKGDDQICVTGKPVSGCYKLEISSTDPTLYRVTVVVSGRMAEIRVSKDGAVATVKGSPRDTGEKGGAGAASAAEMANKLANPTAALGSMANHLTYTSFDGDLPDADNQEGWTYLFQPSLPFPLKSGANILFRPGIPVILDTPVPAIGGGFESKGVELGDIPFDLAYGKTFKNGFMLLGDAAGTLPTATDDALGKDQ